MFLFLLDHLSFPVYKSLTLFSLTGVFHLPNLSLGHHIAIFWQCTSIFTVRIWKSKSDKVKLYWKKHYWRYIVSSWEDEMRQVTKRLRCVRNALNRKSIQIFPTTSHRTAIESLWDMDESYKIRNKHLIVTMRKIFRFTNWIFLKN